MYKGHKVIIARLVHIVLGEITPTLCNRTCTQGWAFPTRRSVLVISPFCIHIKEAFRTVSCIGNMNVKKIQAGQAPYQKVPACCVGKQAGCYYRTFISKDMISFHTKLWRSGYLGIQLKHTVLSVTRLFLDVVLYPCAQYRK